MFSEKPEWVRHGGIHIFSIDIQPGALRFATAGGDHKVRIWNMKSVGKQSGDDQSTKRLLATLRDHFGSVNCVRWAKHGRYIASGSDDRVILIHERKPGLGTTEFGSGEPPDVENWKVITTLRGHTADVVDLTWSPDDSTLASSSLDNTIHIWNLTNGMCTAVLRGHSSFVKGVAWDPIGSFIASQSDDKTVIIWRTSDWSLVHKTEGHWAKSVGSTFFRRLGWSPCGHFITTTHGYQKPRHSAPVLERGEWSATFDFLGHNAPVVVVKFNHSMFRKNVSNGHEVSSSPTGWTNGALKTAEKESQPYNVIAIGSQDRTVTVWTTASARPLIVAKHYFSQSVVDLSWSPDGYSLFACSLDGTIAIFDFEVKELGNRLSDAELDELKRSRYGDFRGRQANLAESPAQLLLETTSIKPSTNNKASLVKRNEELVSSAEEPAKIANTQALVKSLGEKTDGKENENADDKTNKVSSMVMSSQVKQREYRRPDGRKRIIPEAVGVATRNENVSQALDFPNLGADQQNDENTMLLGDGGKINFIGKQFTENSEANNRHYVSPPGSGLTARVNINESLVIERMPISAGYTAGSNVETSDLTERSGSKSEILSICVLSSKEEDNAPVSLEARPVERALADVVGIGNASLGKETEIVCKRGTEILWFDRISPKVTVLAGNANFWAIGSEDGCLQIYTRCGRRALPAMMMGSAAIFIDCDECWKLLIVTRRGLLYVWDLFNRTCLLHDTLYSLINLRDDSSRQDAGTTSSDKVKVISARFSRSGSPLVVLSTRHAFLFDMNLMCWLRVADDCFPSSNFTSSFNLSSVRGGELANLHIDVGKFMARKPSWSRVTDDVVQTRAHLETRLASSLALQSPNEYRQCLLSYIRFLARVHRPASKFRKGCAQQIFATLHCCVCREADESRLREVCESFLGPPTGIAEVTLSDPKNPAWDPCVLGMKKHKLLKEDILPAMASNRKVQRLLNEFMDILSEYGSNEVMVDQSNRSHSREDAG